VHIVLIDIANNVSYSRILPRHWHQYLPKHAFRPIEHWQKEPHRCNQTKTIKSTDLSKEIFQVIHYQEQNWEWHSISQPKRCIRSSTHDFAIPSIICNWSNGCCGRIYSSNGNDNKSPLHFWKRHEYKPQKPQMGCIHRYHKQLNPSFTCTFYTICTGAINGSVTNLFITDAPSVNGKRSHNM